MQKYVFFGGPWGEESVQMHFSFRLPGRCFIVGGARVLVDESESELLLSELSLLLSLFVSVFGIHSI